MCHHLSGRYRSHRRRIDTSSLVMDSVTVPSVELLKLIGDTGDCDRE